MQRSTLSTIGAVSLLAFSVLLLISTGPPSETNGAAKPHRFSNVESCESNELPSAWLQPPMRPAQTNSISIEGMDLKPDDLKPIDPKSLTDGWLLVQAATVR